MAAITIHKLPERPGDNTAHCCTCSWASGSDTAYAEGVKHAAANRDHKVHLMTVTEVQVDVHDTDPGVDLLVGEHTWQANRGLN